MILLGALLALLAILVIVAAASRANEAASLDLGVFTLNTTAVGVFLAGAVTLLVLVLGLWFIANGLRRARKKRVEVKQLRQRAQESAQRENERSSRPVAPPRRKRSERRRVREEPVVVREPIEPPENETSQPTGAHDTTPDAGPDEHFKSAPRER
jgi:ABC-type nickel/cobalt efflux system permease component RcnA